MLTVLVFDLPVEDVELDGLKCERGRGEGEKERDLLTEKPKLANQSTKAANGRVDFLTMGCL